MDFQTWLIPGILLVPIGIAVAVIMLGRFQARRAIRKLGRPVEKFEAFHFFFDDQDAKRRILYAVQYLLPDNTRRVAIVLGGLFRAAVQQDQPIAEWRLTTAKAEYSKERVRARARQSKREARYGKKRPRPGIIDDSTIDHVIALAILFANKSPVKDYVSSMLLDIRSRNETNITLSEARLPPAPTEKPAETPSFNEVLFYLQCMSDKNNEDPETIFLSTLNFVMQGKPVDLRWQCLGEAPHRSITCELSPGATLDIPAGNKQPRDVATGL